MIGYQIRKRREIITKEDYNLPSFPQLKEENRFATRIKVVFLAMVGCSTIFYAAGSALNLFALPFFPSFWIFSNATIRLLVAGMIAVLGVEILLVCVTFGRRLGVFRRLDENEGAESDLGYLGTAS